VTESGTALSRGRLQHVSPLIRMLIGSSLWPHFGGVEVEATEALRVDRR